MGRTLSIVATATDSRRQCLGISAPRSVVNLTRSASSNPKGALSKVGSRINERSVAGSWEGPRCELDQGLSSIRVIVAGYGPVYRAGLSAVLPTSEPEGRVAVLAGASSLTKRVGLVRLLRPDVVNSGKA